MSDLRMVNLENCFNKAVEVKANYVAIIVEMEGFKEKEVIINPIENVDNKLAYYKGVYDDNLNHIFSKGIRIVGCTYGNSFTDIEFDLIGDED